MTDRDLTSELVEIVFQLRDVVERLGEIACGLVAVELDDDPESPLEEAA